VLLCTACAYSPEAPSISLTPRESARPSISTSGDLYVLTPNQIQVYGAGSKNLARTITLGPPSGSATPGILAIDRKGDVYVANCIGSTVAVLPPGATVPKYYIGWGIATPVQIAFDPSDNVYVANSDTYSRCQGALGPSSVYEFPPGKQIPSRAITSGTHYITAIAFDGAGNLYVANCPACSAGYFYGPSGYGSVAVYPPGKVKPSYTLIDGIKAPNSIAVDPSGTVYVGNSADGSISVYEHGDRSPSYTIPSADGYALQIAPSGDLYVANGAHVLIYKRGQSSPAVMIPGPKGWEPLAVAFDKQGDAYVMSEPASPSSSGSVTVYASGKTTVLRTITAGLAPGASLAGIAVSP